MGFEARRALRKRSRPAKKLVILVQPAMPFLSLVLLEIQNNIYYISLPLMSPCHKRQPLILCNQKYHYTAAGLLFDWFEFSGLTKYKLQQIFCSEESNPVKLETSQTDSERVLVKIVYLTSEEAASVEASFPYPRGYPFETTWDFPACSLGSCKRPDAGFATHLMGLSQWRHVAAC